MGKTSPNNKIKKVTKITSTINFITFEAILEKTESSENEKRITIEMCKKLLATNMVASVFFGLDNNWFIKTDFDGFFWDRSERFFGDKEKSATSAAATIAVQKSKIKIPIIPKIKLVSIDEREIKLESESKFN